MEYLFDGLHYLHELSCIQLQQKRYLKRQLLLQTLLSLLICLSVLNHEGIQQQYRLVKKPFVRLSLSKPF